MSLVKKEDVSPGVLSNEMMSSRAMGFLVAILGNPVPKTTLEQIISLQKPHFFQVSLEGLPGNNDDILGKGYFPQLWEEYF